MIRRILLLIVALLSPAIAIAQSDTATASFDVNGLKVILRRNTANDVVAANMYLLGGVQQVTPATQGIENFLLQASERGTKLFPVRQLDRLWRGSAATSMSLRRKTGPCSASGASGRRSTPCSPSLPIA